MRARLSPPRTWWTALIALCAAVLALLAALVAAVGPAHGERAEYSWPPRTLPAGSPSDGWYAPLALLNRVPGSIEVRLPCALAPALGSDRPVTVLATARRPETADALRITLEGNLLRIRVGTQEAARMAWPGSCPLAVEISDGVLHLAGRAVVLRTETLEDMPIVTGLFTDLDLRAGEPPRIVVRTRVYETSQTARQIVAASLAVVLAGAALILLACSRRWARPRRFLRHRVQSVWHALDGTDAVVVGALLVWWILAPTMRDDGWLWVEHRALAKFGVDSIYFDNWGLGFPVGYWLTWLGQSAIGSASDLIFMRLPSLAAALASWALCRWCLRNVVEGRPPTAVRWVLAGAFLVGATAWLSTLRFEPFISLLALASVAAMVSFVRAPSPVPLEIAVLAAVLAATAHPVGILAAAPLFAGLPQVVQWLRAGPRQVPIAVATLLLAGLAVALVLFTVDADLATRFGEARLVRQNELQSEPWWREYIRYAEFDANGGQTAIRRLSLALFGLCVVAWLTRTRASRTGVSFLPAGSVAAGLVLLSFISSKWPWHFGALVAVGAVATAAESTRLIRERDLPVSWIRPAIAVVVVGLAVLWSWDAAGDWSPVDLQEARWSYGFGIRGRSWWVALLLAPVVLGVLVWCVRRARWVAERLALIATWTLAVVTSAAVGVTAAILAYDAAISPWSPARQNLEALVGRKSCGFAHLLSGEGALVDRVADPATPTLVVPSIGLYFPCATIPAIDGGVVEIPGLVIFESFAWPLHTVHGPFAAVPDLYELTSIGQGPHNVGVLSVADEVPGFVRAGVVRRDLGAGEGSSESASASHLKRW